MKVQKKNEIKNPNVAKTNKGKQILISKFPVCNSKKVKIYQKARSQLIIKLTRIKNRFK